MFNRDRSQGMNKQYALKTMNVYLQRRIGKFHVLKLYEKVEK